jgi:hypothetical protein
MFPAVMAAYVAANTVSTTAGAYVAVHSKLAVAA